MCGWHCHGYAADDLRRGLQQDGRSNVGTDVYQNQLSDRALDLLEMRLDHHLCAKRKV